MSGGSWGYFYSTLDDVADRLCHSEQPERRALGRELRRFSPALHAIEWVDSCDWGPPDDTDAIREALGDRADALILGEAVERATAMAEELRGLIEKARGAS